ncbi:unnamed protein product, partial [Brassica oleracea var. botrytis]
SKKKKTGSKTPSISTNEANASVELNQQNSGRVSVLCEATQFLKDVFGQIESLINGHTCLLSDSNYVTTEKNELQGRNISARDRDI